MHLTREEEKILEGEEGEGKQKAMELLVALGDIYDAENLIGISSAQVSGVSYKTIGDAGIDFLKDWAAKKVKTKVLTTLNPMGVDLDLWKELGYPEKFVKRQVEILKAYEAMGISPSCTCTPYLAGNLPRFGESIAWAESSSVIFANSVFGARTNRESGISALASAIIGKTPCYGLHLDENRKASFVVDVNTKMRNQTDYAALGYYIGKYYDGIPIFKNIAPAMEEMKALAAALGVGPVTMFHVAETTPEYKKMDQKGLEKIEIGKEELKDAYEMLNTTDEIDLICIGCPHCSIREILDVVKINPKKEVWVFTAKQNKVMIEKRVKNEKIRIISDTCMVVSPLEDLGIKAIGVNSAKAAFYSMNLSNLGVKFDSLERLVEG